MAIKAGKYVIELVTALGPGFKKGLDKAGGKLRGAGKAFSAATSLGGFGGLAGGLATGGVVAGVTLAVRNLINAGDALDKMSKRTGFAVEKLSALGFAAELSGSNIENVETAIRGMNRNIGNLRLGMEEATKAFGQLGLTWKDLENLDAGQRFDLIADRLAGIEDNAERVSIAMKVMEEAGVALLPMFENGSAGMKQVAEDAAALGIIMSADTATAAAELKDEMTKLNLVTKAVANSLLKQMIPTLYELTKAALQFAMEIKPRLTAVGAVWDDFASSVNSWMGPPSDWRQRGGTDESWDEFVTAQANRGKNRGYAARTEMERIDRLIKNLDKLVAVGVEQTQALPEKGKGSQKKLPGTFADLTGLEGAGVSFDPAKLQANKRATALSGAMVGYGVTGREFIQGEGVMNQQLNIQKEQLSVQKELLEETKDWKHVSVIEFGT